MSEPIPSYIGPYPVRGVIGSGAMGMVYLAHDPGIERSVAIKTIHTRLLEREGDASIVARFRVEAKAAGRLNHRHIVSIYQFGEDRDCAYIVMEYVAGRSLRDYIQAPRQMGVPLVVSLVVQLLEALQYAHERGVVHRDIKPANLMIGDDGRLKVTDFGIARTESSNLTRVNSVIGSPGYIAPEQYTGGTVDGRVDVFAAGVLLYQMLAGHTPFSGTDDAIMYKIVYEPHQPLSVATGDATLAPFDAVLDRALAKSPDDRFASAQAMRDALLAIQPPPLPEGIPVEQRLAGRFRMPAAGYAAPVGGAPTPPPAAAGHAPASAAGASSPASVPGWPASQPPRSGGSGPSSVPVPTGWDDAVLATIERELARHVGPVARVLVRRAARGLTSVAAVRQAVATSIADIAAREKFLNARDPSPTAGAGRTTTATAGAPAAGAYAATRLLGEVPGGTPMREGDVERAATALLPSLGPIARVVARKCAAQVHTREQFVERVLSQLAPGVPARDVEAALWRALT